MKRRLSVPGRVQASQIDAAEQVGPLQGVMPLPLRRRPDTTSFRQGQILA